MPVLLPVPQVLLEFQLQAVQALPGSQEYPGLDFLGFRDLDPPGSDYPDSGYLDSGYPGSDYLDLDYPGSDCPGSGYPDLDYPGSGYPDSGYPGSDYLDLDYPGLDFQDSPDLDSLGSRDLWCL